MGALKSLSRCHIWSHRRVPCVNKFSYPASCPVPFSLEPAPWGCAFRHSLLLPHSMYELGLQRSQHAILLPEHNRAAATFILIMLLVTGKGGEMDHEEIRGLLTGRLLQSVLFQNLQARVPHDPPQRSGPEGLGGLGHGRFSMCSYRGTPLPSSIGRKKGYSFC